MAPALPRQPITAQGPTRGPGTSRDELVGLGGFEPPTSPLSGVRSNQLSYRPGRDRTGAAATPRLQISSSSLCGRSRRLHVPLLMPLKEVIQPQVPLRLPCYDFTPVMNHTVVNALPEGLSHPLLVQPTPMV